MHQLLIIAGGVVLGGVLLIGLGMVLTVVVQFWSEARQDRELRELRRWTE